MVFSVGAFKTLIKKIKKIYNNISIKVKLPLLLVVNIFISFLIMGSITYYYIEEITKKKSISYMGDILNAIELRLSDYLNEVIRISQDILYDKRINNLLVLESISDGSIEKFELESQINNIFKRIILTRDEFESITLFMNDGMAFFAAHNGRHTGVSAFYPLEDIQNAARKQNGKATFYIEIKDEKVENIYFARTVQRQDNFSETGLLVFLVKKDFFKTLYSDLITEEITDISIISEDGYVIINKNDEYKYNYNETLLEKMNNDSGSILDNNNKILISYVSLDQTGWKILSHIKLDTLYKDVNRLRLFIFIIGGLAVFLLILLSLMAGADITKPLNKIANEMLNYKNTNILALVNVDRGDEIGQLSKRFNEMSERINYLVKWVYQEQLTRNAAELKALQSQINPHFLFNTLESINWMAQLSNAPQISEVISALSDLMEASIGRDDKLIRFEKELDYVNNYMLIIKFRFEDSFEFITNIAEEALNIEIPRLIIQPLIENAIYHGIAHLKTKGIIRLSAVLSDNFLTISVYDNGRGMRPEKIAEVQESLLVNADDYFKNLTGKENSHVGIENVNRRIKLFYGDEYGLGIESEYECFTETTIRIPVKGEK